MTDSDYWKRAYQHAWGVSGERELFVARILRKAGFEVQLTGFGAGETELLPGRPETYGHEQGDPDLYVVGAEVHVEVTGTNVRGVRPQDDLWVRPDKIVNALRHAERDTWVVHVLDHARLVRCVHLLPAVARDLLAMRRRIERTIRGRRERYVSIGADESVVRPMCALVDFLRQRI